MKKLYGFLAFSFVRSSLIRSIYLCTLVMMGEKEERRADRLIMSAIN